MGDFDLTQLLPRAKPSTVTENIRSVRYVCNLPFVPHLKKPTLNTKFPGSMVVSLTRAMLPRLQGVPPKFVPYKNTHLLPWLQPRVHARPALDKLAPPQPIQNNCVNPDLPPVEQWTVLSFNPVCFLGLDCANIRIFMFDP